LKPCIRQHRHKQGSIAGSLRQAQTLAGLLKERHILVKPLNDERLGPGYMRVTTALPEDNARFVAALRELL